MAIKDKDRTPVAQILVTQCTKCKLPLTHMVVLHNSEGIVERVQCRTCGSEHKYHPDKKKTARKPAKKNPGCFKEPKIRSRSPFFEELAGKLEDKKAVSYTMQGSYRPDDVIKPQNLRQGLCNRGFLSEDAGGFCRCIAHAGLRSVISVSRQPLSRDTVVKLHGMGHLWRPLLPGIEKKSVVVLR